MSKQTHQLYLYRFTIPELNYRNITPHLKAVSIRRTDHNASKIQISINLIRTFFCSVRILLGSKFLVY